MTPRMFLVPAMALALATGCVPKEGLPLGKTPGSEDDSRRTSDQAPQAGTLRLSFTGDVTELLESHVNHGGGLHMEVRVAPAEGEAREEFLVSLNPEDRLKWSDLRFADLAPGDATVTVTLNWDEKALFERTSTLAVPAGKELKASISLALDPLPLPQARPAVLPFLGQDDVTYRDGIGEATGFNSDYGGMALDSAGNLYVADQGNHVIRKVTPHGVVTTFAGQYDRALGGYAEGDRRQAKFYEPTDLVFDNAGNLYVSDSGNHRIRRITPAGVVETFAGTGEPESKDGARLSASFRDPKQLAMDAGGTLYVTDAKGIRTISPDGTVATFVERGAFDLPNGIPSTFGRIEDLAFGPDGVLYLTCGHRILTVSKDRRVSVLAGDGSDQGLDDPLDALNASFVAPSGLAWDGSGGLLVVDFGKLRRITLSGGVTTIKGHDGGELGIYDAILSAGGGLFYVNTGKSRLFL